MSRLSDYDNKNVRLILKSGEFFEGEAEALSAEYCLHEFGFEEEGLQISSEDEEALVDNWVFYGDELQSVSLLPEGGPKAPPCLVYFLSQEEIKTTAWSGGSTAEFLIYPWRASYVARDFLWRISSATVDLPVSDFTPLPDYKRFITPLEGQMVLSIDGGEGHLLQPGDIFAFDGAAATRSEGLCSDFNLMLRKEKAAGGMKTWRLTKDWAAVDVPEDARHLLLYCPKGSCRIQTPFSELLLSPERPVLMIENPGRLLLSASSRDSALLLTIWARRS